MAIRTAAVVVGGALALSAAVVPAAQAAPVNPAAVSAKDQRSGDTRITDVYFSNSGTLVLGTTAKKTFTVAITATDDSGIADGGALLWRGTSLETDGGITDILGDYPEDVDCKKVDKTTSTCTTVITLDPHEFDNSAAGAWHVGIGASGKDEDFTVKDAVMTEYVKRAAKLTVNAAPEPVKKNHTLTVTGALMRANWETRKYAGYGKQKVALQFRPKGGSTYKTVKTVTADSKGALKTTVKATADGTWRYAFAGTGTTSTALAVGDYVDVR